MGGAINTNSTFGSSNFDGNKQSKVCVNQTAGFSMVEYSGSGSSSTIFWTRIIVSFQKMIIVKRTSGAIVGRFIIQSGEGKFVRFRYNSAESSNTNTYFQHCSNKRSTVFSVNHDDTNANGFTFQGYCFADVPGYQKMGLYRGNESSDNQFVYTGFKLVPCNKKIFMVSIIGCCLIIKEESYNPDNDALHPNAQDAEQTDDEIDLLSNGFKIRIK